MFSDGVGDFDEITSMLLHGIMEAQRGGADRLELRTTGVFSVTEPMKFHSQALCNLIMSEFKNKNNKNEMWEHYQFWIARISVSERIKLFENVWKNLNNVIDGKCEALFRGLIISVEKYLDILKAMYYSDANPDALRPPSDLPDHNLFQICQPIIVFANEIYFEQNDFKVSQHITWIYQIIHDFTEKALTQFKQSKLADVESPTSRKKRKITKHSASIHDEDFTPILLENQNDLVVLLNSFDSFSIQEKMEYLKKISMNANTCFNLFRLDLLFDFLQDVITTNSFTSDDVLELFSNVVAQSHVNDVFFEEEFILNLVLMNMKNIHSRRRKRCLIALLILAKIFPQPSRLDWPKYFHTIWGSSLLFLLMDMVYSNLYIR